MAQHQDNGSEMNFQFLDSAVLCIFRGGHFRIRVLGTVTLETKRTLA